jgi:hypothetical protein
MNIYDRLCYWSRAGSLITLYTDCTRLFPPPVAHTPVWLASSHVRIALLCIFLTFHLGAVEQEFLCIRLLIYWVFGLNEDEDMERGPFLYRSRDLRWAHFRACLNATRTTEDT